MNGRPATATERFKTLLIATLERVCVLEEQLEIAQRRIEELEQISSKPEKSPPKGRS